MRTTLVLAAVTCSLTAQESRPSSRPAADGEPRVEQPELARNGGYLGIFFAEVRLGERHALDVRAVQKGSDAARLGFSPGDRIVAVDGRPFGNGDEFIKALWSQARARRKAKTAHTVTVLRGEREVELQAGLADLDRTPAVGDRAPDFTLREADGKTAWQLQQKLAAGRPVVLVFGSYT